jgi:TorA maturation chaperone TorD
MIAPEEQARANLYGLLARLFYAPPDAELLKGISVEKLEGELAAPWSEVASAAAAADPNAVREEYESAFIGTGKAPVTLYTTAYATRRSDEVPLAELRGYGDLASAERFDNLCVGIWLMRHGFSRGKYRNAASVFSHLRFSKIN